MAREPGGPPQWESADAAYGASSDPSRWSSDPSQWESPGSPYDQPAAAWADPPTTPATVAAPPQRRAHPVRRLLLIGASVLAVVVIAGIAGALLLPGHGPFRTAFGSGGPGYGWSDGPGYGRHGDGMGHWNNPGYGMAGPGGFGDRVNGAVLTGTVVSTGNRSLVIAVDAGGQRTLATDDRTRVRTPNGSSLGDLAAGERVAVTVEGAGAGAVARLIWAPQAGVTGTVTAVSGDEVTVLSVDGLAVTADVSALSQKPAVGDVVVLSGTASDQSTLKAERIRILPKAS